MKRLFILAVLLTFSAPAFALEEPPAIKPEEAKQRAAQLRAEATAHQGMERQLAAQTGGSRRDRRWRRNMIELCRQYTEAATRAAEAYERAVAAEAEEPSAELVAHASLPATAAEYNERAAEYQARAESLRADADQHLAMLRWSRNADLPQQPYSDTGGTGQRRTATWIDTPQRRAAREHCQEIARHGFELAIDADNIARHYRLRARQLEAAR